MEYMGINPSTKNLRAKVLLNFKSIVNRMISAIKEKDETHSINHVL